jgi:type VI secretion system protein ImpM
MAARTLTEVGFYGKLPCRGDFLQRRAPQEFVDVWDAWLQECIHASREQLQDSWLQAYLTGPVWRFAFAAGVCGDAAYAGILVPSVDRVGRYFPLTVMAQLDASDSPLHVACSSTSWFDAAETLVLDALEAEALDFDTFDERIALLRDELATGGAGESAQLATTLKSSDFPAQPVRWHVPLEGAASLQSAVNALAYRELSRAIQPLAMWWTQGSDAVRPCWLTTPGLPEASAFVAMLSGDWGGADWRSSRMGGLY